VVLVCFIHGVQELNVCGNEKFQCLDCPDTLSVYNF